MLRSRTSFLSSSAATPVARLTLVYSKRPSPIGEREMLVVPTSSSPACRV